MWRVGTAAAGAAFVLAAGCGGDSERTVAVTLQDGRGTATMTACGGEDAFELYRRSDRVRYAGNVDPPPGGRWKAKVQVKKCTGREYVESREQKIVGQANGAFAGSFQDLAPGAYFLRARYQGEDRPETAKVYFKVD